MQCTVCTPYSRTYHIAQWSSRLDWSKFVYRDEYRNDKKCCFLCVLSKNTHKTHKIVKVAVINDNNNFAPSLFRSLCEFVGDCFRPRYFSSGAAFPQKNTSVQNNHLRFHTMTSKKMVRSYYCPINVAGYYYVSLKCYLSMHKFWEWRTDWS